MGEAEHVWGPGLMGNLSTFCSIFLLTLKVLKKISFFKESNTLILLTPFPPKKGSGFLRDMDDSRAGQESTRGA